MPNRIIAHFYIGKSNPEIFLVWKTEVSTDITISSKIIQTMEQQRKKIP